MKKVNNVLNIVFMNALTNGQIQEENPSKYIANFNKTYSKFNQILNTHFIELNGYGIENDAFEKFLTARSVSIYRTLIKRIIANQKDKLEMTE